MTNSPFKLTWRTKLLGLLLFFSLTPILAFSFWMFRDLDQRFEDATVTSLEGLVQAKGLAIEQFMTNRVRQVERISNLLVPELVELRSSPPDLPKPEGTDLPEPVEVRQPDKPVPPETNTPGTTPSESAAPSTSPTLKSGSDTEPPTTSVTQPNEQPRAAEQQAPGNQAEPQPATEPAPPPEPTPPTRAALRKALGLILWDQQEYEELLVMDPEGNVVASTFDDHEGKTAANLDYFKKGLGATYVQQPFTSPITEKLTMVIATPIKDESQQVVGVLAVRLNLDTFFRLIGDRTGLGETGETVVGHLVDSEIVFMAPTHHDTEAALTRKIVTGSPSGTPLQEAAREQSGSGPAIDYRDKPVYAAWQPLPSLQWGLVVKMDQAESRKATIAARNQAILLTLVIVVLAIMCSIFMSQALVGPLQALKSATEKISRGDLDVRLSINSTDEVGDLAASFERMVAAIKFFMEDKEEEQSEAEEPA